MLAEWIDVKSVLVNRSLSAQYTIIGTNFWIKAIDGSFEIECIIPTDTSNADSLDFVTNFQPNANQPLVSPIQGTVTTQFEKRDKTIKLANLSGSVQEDGTVTAYLKVPGTPNPTGDNSLDGRWISSGTAFFDVATPGDIISSVRFVDHDNMLGYGEDFVVGSYTDDELDAANQGWFIPPKKGEIKAEAIGGYGFAPAGFYIMVTAKKGGGITTGTFYVNFEWGKSE